MRQLRALALVFAIASSTVLAGCLGGDDEEGGDGMDGGTNTTTPGGGTGTGSGTGSGSGSGSGTNTTTPPTTQRPANVNETFTLTIAPGPASAATHPFNVPAAGWRSFTVTLTPTPPAGSQAVFLTDNIDVNVLDPAGEVAGTATFGAGPATAQTVTVSSGTAGAWTVSGTARTVSGGATFSGTISITY